MNFAKLYTYLKSYNKIYMKQENKNTIPYYLPKVETKFEKICSIKS